MTTAVSIEQAQASLSDLIRALAPGDEIVITENDRPVASLTAISSATPHRKLGTMRGTVTYMAPDFDLPLDDFQELPCRP